MPAAPPLPLERLGWQPPWSRDVLPGTVVVAGLAELYGARVLDEPASGPPGPQAGSWRDWPGYGRLPEEEFG